MAAQECVLAEGEGRLKEGRQDDQLVSVGSRVRILGVTKHLAETNHWART